MWSCTSIYYDKMLVNSIFQLTKLCTQACRLEVLPVVTIYANKSCSLADNWKVFPKMSSPLIRLTLRLVVE